MARVLTSYLKKMIFIIMHDPLAFAFNYADGIMNIMTEVANFCDLIPDHEVQIRSEERCRYHAKHPQQLFSADFISRDIPEYLAPAYEAYNQLELLRGQKHIPEKTLTP